MEIFYSTTTKSKAEEKFELRTLIENEDEDEEEVPLNQGLIYYSREGEHFRKMFYLATGPVFKNWILR